MAYGRVVLRDRMTTTGEPFAVGAPDFGVALVELEEGPVVRLTTSFYVGHQSKQGGLEFHGDTGSLFLDSWQHFDAALEIAPFGGAYEPVPVHEPFHGTDWGRALAELSEAISEGRPQRATGTHAAHVVEILEAIASSSADGRPVEVTSVFEAPRPPSPHEDDARERSNAQPATGAR